MRAGESCLDWLGSVLNHHPAILVLDTNSPPLGQVLTYYLGQQPLIISGYLFQP